MRQIFDNITSSNSTDILNYYDNITSTNYTDTLNDFYNTSLSNCTNIENNIDITIPTLLLTKPCGLIFMFYEFDGIHID